MRRQLVRPLVTAALLAVAPAGSAAQEPGAAVSQKSPELAVGLSLLGTVVPIALALRNPNGAGAGWLLFYGVYMGPSTGYLYAGRPGLAFEGAGIRLGFTALTAVGIAAACGGDVIWGCEDEPAANVVALVGLALIGASAVYDIAGAGTAAQEWNLKHSAPRFSLEPLVDPAARRAGLGVRVAF